MPGSGGYVTVNLRNVRPVSEFIQTIAMLHSGLTNKAINAPTPQEARAFSYAADLLEQALLQVDFDSE